MIQVPTQQIAGVYHRRIGDIVVTALSDGYLDGTVEVMQNIAPDDATRMLSDAFRPGRRTSVNAYLVYSAGRLALIETGSGDYLLPTAGKLQAEPEGRRHRSRVDREGDPDAHASGPLGRADRSEDGGKTVSRTPSWWCTRTSRATGRTTRAMARAERTCEETVFPVRPRADGAVSQRDAHRSPAASRCFPASPRCRCTAIRRGIRGYMVSSGKDSLLIWGDIVHVPEIQVPRPEVTMEFDTDPHAAAATRKRMFDMVATDRQLIAGMHVHFPGFAHVVKHGDGYTMVPEPWDQAFGG